MISYLGLPAVTAAEMRLIDETAIKKYGIPADVLMENAGKAVAAEAIKFCKRKNASCCVVCGHGNNGGDGLVAARHLLQAGIETRAFIAAPKNDAAYGKLVLRNIKRALLRHVSVKETDSITNELSAALSRADIVVDALLGTGSSGAPHGIIAELIKSVNRSGKPVIAVDIPSGIDADTGLCAGECVKARITVALGLPKTGLLAKTAKIYLGKLKVADIGFPKELTAGFSR